MKIKHEKFSKKTNIWGVLFSCNTFKKNFMAPFYGWGSTVSRLEPLRGGSLLFTTKLPEISGTHFINLGRMKDWVDLGATPWFWTWEPWIGNPMTFYQLDSIMCLHIMCHWWISSFEIHPFALLPTICASGLSPTIS